MSLFALARPANEVLQKLTYLLFSGFTCNWCHVFWEVGRSCLDGQALQLRESERQRLPSECLLKKTAKAEGRSLQQTQGHGWYRCLWNPCVGAVCRLGAQRVRAVTVHHDRESKLHLSANVTLPEPTPLQDPRCPQSRRGKNEGL